MEERENKMQKEMIITFMFVSTQINSLVFPL